VFSSANQRAPIHGTTVQPYAALPKTGLLADVLVFILGWPFYHFVYE
jgi:hypothetical protein